MNSIFNQLLNVKNMVVETARIVDSPLRPTPVLEIRVRPRKGMLRCSRCGRRRHGYDQGGGMRRWRHQDFGCWRVELVAMMPRVDCPKCGVVVARVPWAEPGSRFTRDFETECAWLMSVANQKTVSGFLRIAWRTAGDIAHRVAERLRTSMPSPFDGLTAIGVDETSYRKGHTYLTVVVDHERHRVIWAHDGYGKDVFDLFFQQLTDEQKESIKVVTGDGARWIDSCVAEHCPNAERVLDGFHIVSWMTGTLDKVRKRLWNQARRKHDEEATQRMRGVKYAVLKNPDQLTGKQNETLDALGNTDPKGQLYRSWQLKELLRTLLKHPLDQAKTELNHWVFWASHSRIPEIVELSKKIRRRRPDILRTIELGYSNARLEAFNNRIKVTIRMAYGFHHVNNLIALIMLRCGGLNIQLPTPAI
ncbi:ISL3 family transposase [Bifidobacterium amazonense]|uniref:ISL3 family transposase n=1 Tax=Bifidobacterium amazonense TaxID=2809027 RepID=A0ABS9VX18_9BIFI|nr:ISL3 family transposase [Bifidobacterium amazonense]MCH9276657.1 ISL3 family transposase [Bifidobacterium amazonense]